MAIQRNSVRAILALLAGAAPLSICAVVSLAAVALPEQAMAQAETNGSFVANVVDASGRPVAGAQIVLRNQALGLTRTLTTDAGGVARAASVPTGAYTATVTRGGFQTLSAPDLQVALGGDSTFPLQLAAEGAVASTVVVTGRRRNPQLDFSRASKGSTYDITQLQKTIPVARNVTAVALLTPGVTLPVSGFANTDGSPVPVIGGSSAGENAFYLNGLNITNFDTYIGGSVVPFDFYQNIQILTGGLPAEYGRATGGVINATTKSGTNDFHFGIHEYYSPSATRSTSPNSYTTANSEYRETNNQLVFEAGGPVIKDHVFLYGLYSLNNDVNETASITGREFDKSRDNSPFYGYKADVFLTSKQHLEFTDFNTTSVTSRRAFNYDPTVNARQDELGGTTFKAGGNNFVAKYTGTFTDWFTLSGAYGHSNDESYTFPATAGGSYVTDSRLNGTAVRLSPVIAANSTSNFDNTHREFYRADGDFNFQLFGHHHVRVGFDHENTDLFHANVRSGGFAYALARVRTTTQATTLNLPLNQEYVRVETARFGGADVTGENEAYYIEDSWDVTKQLSFNLGLRDDNFLVNNLAGAKTIDLDKNFGPRIAAVYDPIGRGRDKLSASYSRLFIAPASNAQFRGADLYYRTYFLPPAGLSFNPYLNSVGVPAQLGTQISAVNNPAFAANFGSNAACPAGGERPEAAVGSPACIVFGDGSTNPADSTASLNLKATEEDEYVLSYEHKFSNLWRGYTSFTFRKLNRTSEDVALDTAILKYCARNATTTTGCNDPNLPNIFGGESSYQTLNPGVNQTIRVRSDLSTPLAGQIINLTAADLQNPKPTRKYYEFILGFERAFDGKWGVSASYTLSFLRGNYEGTVKSDAGNTAQVDAGTTQDFDLPGLEEYTTGYLPNDRRHQFKIQATYSPFEGLRLGVNARIEAPRKYGCIGFYPATGTILGDPNAADYGAASRYCVDPNTGQSRPVPRGSAFEGDWVSQVDLQVNYTVPRFNQYVPPGLTVRAEVFNLFDTNSVTQFDEVGDSDAGVASPTYGQPLLYQPPRYVRFGFDLVF